MDVLNLTGTAISLHDDECCAFHTDATGAALNYKIIVRDGGVIAVLYQEDGAIRPSPFVEHRLPPAGSFVVLPDGSLGKLGALPRGLVVAREPRDLPEHAPMWPCLPGLRHKGKHPAELPGLVDLQLLQRDGCVSWPPHECAVPVCALTVADSSRLHEWHTQWDAYVKERSDAAHEAAKHIDKLLHEGKSAEASPKEVVRELTEAYSSLEERQRELLEMDATGVDAERLAALQRGIQRFATLARFG